MSSRVGSITESDHNKKRGMVLPFVPLSIVFDNIIYVVDMPPEMQAQGQAQDRLELLKGVSGASRPATTYVTSKACKEPYLRSFSLQKDIGKRRLQLLGITCMLFASSLTTPTQEESDLWIHLYALSLDCDLELYLDHRHQT
ncbi:hypothetical protein Tco_0955612 [Tanacetum coccineum]|uniref:Uncharacterized protein n=1 Tax=Tanacetum coccineum TaxID=301880 RepID=A0ABQ5E7Q4_9ASTR